MSLLCNPKNKPTDEQLDNQKLFRDIGLSPINNIYSEVDMCSESFEGFNYNMTGATKGNEFLDINSKSAHNLSNKDFVSIVFEVNEGDDYLNYEGNFCFIPVPTTSTTNPPIKRCVEYKDIPNDGVFGWDLSELLKSDYQYTVSTKHRFYSKCITSNYGFSGTTLVEGNSDTDYYFVTVINPPNPEIKSDLINTLNEISFVNEDLSTEVIEGSTMLELTAEPLGNIVAVVVNGINLDTSDYSIVDRLVRFSEGIEIEQTDSVSVYYSKYLGNNPSQAGYVFNITNLDVFTVNEIHEKKFNEGETSYDNFINDNTEAGRLEVFLKDDVDDSVQPILTINGLDLVFNRDFFKSNKVKNKLVIAPGVIIGIKDVVSVFYYRSSNNSLGDLGILLTNQPEIKWSLPNLTLKEGSYGEFFIEVTDSEDFNFDNILLTNKRLYSSDIIDYTYTISPITTKGISDYRYRVRFDKTFLDSKGFKYTTTSYSLTNHTFSIDWDYIDNTNV